MRACVKKDPESGTQRQLKWPGADQDKDLLETFTFFNLNSWQPLTSKFAMKITLEIEDNLDMQF